VAADPVDKVVDRLYGLEPGEFVRARDAAARELREAGLRAEAARVKELRRPSAAAGAVNRLVRTHRSEVKRFLAAAGALRKAQLQGRELETPTRREREALDVLVRAGGEEVRQSLRAAAADEEAARRLLEARLEQELEPRGFGTLLWEVPATAPARRKAASPPAPKKPDTRAARAELREAERALAAARVGEREAREAWKLAEGGLRQAEKAVARAEEKLAGLEQWVVGKPGS
jgi:hypothetical protein